MTTAAVGIGGIYLLNKVQEMLVNHSTARMQGEVVKGLMQQLGIKPRGYDATWAKSRGQLMLHNASTFFTRRSPYKPTEVAKLQMDARYEPCDSNAGGNLRGNSSVNDTSSSSTVVSSSS